MPNGRCRIHGGTSLSGIAHPNFKDGTWAKDLPPRIRGKALEAYTDPDLLSQSKALSILEARFWDVMQSTSNQESGELWQALQQAKQAYYKADGRDKDEQQAEALKQVWWLIAEGFNERQNWRELRDIIQEMRVVRESERKRNIELQTTLSSQQANVLLGAVGHSVMTAMAALKAELARVAPEDAERIVKGALQSISSDLSNLANVGT